MQHDEFIKNFGMKKIKINLPQRSDIENLFLFPKGEHKM